jgi:hypothetical protein
MKGKSRNLGKHQQQGSANQNHTPEIKAQFSIWRLDGLGGPNGTPFSRWKMVLIFKVEIVHIDIEVEMTLSIIINDDKSAIEKVNRARGRHKLVLLLNLIVLV